MCKLTGIYEQLMVQYMSILFLIQIKKYKFETVLLFFSSTSDHASNSQLQDEATSISELPGYVGPSASNVEVDAAENARGSFLYF